MKLPLGSLGKMIANILLDELAKKAKDEAWMRAHLPDDVEDTVIMAAPILIEAIRQMVNS